MPLAGGGLGGALGPLGQVPLGGYYQTYYGDIVEGLALSQAQVVGQTGVATDALHLSPVLDEQRQTAKTATATLNLSTTLATTWGHVVEELVRLTSTPTPNLIRGVGLADGLELSAALTAALPATITEHLTLHAVASVAQVVVVLEQLGLTPTLSALATYGVNLREAIQLRAALARFIGASVEETVMLDAVLSTVAKAYSAVTESLALDAVLTPQLVLSAVVEEGIELTPTMALQAIFQPEIVEGLELTIGFVEPNGAISTWVMNTRSGAVTEYTNYEFNSFAKIGNKYLGADSTGVYELLGDDDAGSPIVAELKGAFLQFGGTKLSRLKEAYIAATGDEDTFVLKIETLDGDSYTYSIDTRSGRSSKFNMGKGQRSRYFAYTLTSVGQDFDLDTLEFVPIVMQRRV